MFFWSLPFFAPTSFSDHPELQNWFTQNLETNDRSLSFFLIASLTLNLNRLVTAQDIERLVQDIRDLGSHYVAEVWCLPMGPDELDSFMTGIREANERILRATSAKEILDSFKEKEACKCGLERPTFKQAAEKINAQLKATDSQYPNVSPAKLARKRELIRSLYPHPAQYEAASKIQAAFRKMRIRMSHAEHRAMALADRESRAVEATTRAREAAKVAVASAFAVAESRIAAAHKIHNAFRKMIERVAMASAVSVAEARTKAAGKIQAAFRKANRATKPLMQTQSNPQYPVLPLPSPSLRLYPTQWPNVQETTRLTKVAGRKTVKNATKSNWWLNSILTVWGGAKDMIVGQVMIRQISPQHVYPKIIHDQSIKAHPQIVPYKKAHATSMTLPQEPGLQQTYRPSSRLLVAPSQTNVRSGQYTTAHKETYIHACTTPGSAPRQPKLASNVLPDLSAIFYTILQLSLFLKRRQRRARFALLAHTTN